MIRLASPRSRDDAGVTLIEMLVALSILSIAGVAILAGLQMTVRTSDITRKQANGGALVRNWAEAIEQHLETTGNYKACAGVGAYLPGYVNAAGVTVASRIGDFTLPPRYIPEASAATPLAGDGTPRAVSPSCKDQGIQRVRLTVRSKDQRASEHLTIVLRKNCGVGSSC